MFIIAAYILKYIMYIINRGSIIDHLLIWILLYYKFT